MPPSFYCKPRWIKAEGRSTGNSLAPPTQVAFMNNQSKMCLSEQHCSLYGTCRHKNYLVQSHNEPGVQLYSAAISTKAANLQVTHTRMFDALLAWY